MGCVWYAEINSTEKGITARNVLKKEEFTIEKTIFFIENITFARSVGNRLFSEMIESAQNAGLNGTIRKSLLRKNKNKGTVRGSKNSKNPYIKKEKSREFVRDVEKEKQKKGRQSVLYALRKMQNCIEKNTQRNQT